MQDVANCAPLRTGEAEGERSVERGHTVRAAGNGLAVDLTAAQERQSGREDEKFLKDQTPPGFVQKLCVQRPVDHLVGHRGRAEMILLPDGFRQDVGQFGPAGV